MAQKFTAAEWATMEGGHELPQVESSNFSFLNDLHEARMTRNESDARVLTYTDCCERLYLSVLVLELMRLYPTAKPKALAYARKTNNYGNFDNFRISATDLHNLAYFITGEDKVLDKLKDPDSAKRLRSTTHFPTQGFKRYLSKLSGGTALASTELKVILDIETSLKISNSDYKATRRALMTWSNLLQSDRKKYATRLLFAVRAKLRNSDLISDFEELINRRDFEIDTANDPEPTISQPDIETKVSEMNFYRYLIGSGNLQLARLFLQNVKDGKNATSTQLRAYSPIVKLVDEIVQAGPSYIQQLRVLADRAKRKK